jgi:hypothetical protein
MEQEILEIVLTQVAEAQKETLQTEQELIKEVREMNALLKGFDKKLEQQRIIVPPADTLFVQAMVADGIKEIRAIVAAQPKTVVHEKRFLLFPKDDYDQYYKIIFGRILPWALLFCIVFRLISLGNERLQESAKLREEELKSSHYQRYYQFMYDKSGKAGRKDLQDIWDSSWDYHTGHPNN